MENYRMNCRNLSNRRNCAGEQSQKAPQVRNASPVTASSDSSHVDLQKLPLAMGYVPMQQYTETFDVEKALENGTVFPELCKPFCGKGGGCGC